MIKNLLPRTLFARSLLILVTPIVLIQIITAFIFLDRHWDRITSRLAFSVAAELNVITNLIERDARGDILVYLKESAAPQLDFEIDYASEGIFKKITQHGAQDFWQDLWLKSLQREMRASLAYDFVIFPDHSEKYFRIDIDMPDGVLQVDVAKRRLFSSTSYIFLLWMFGSSILLLLIAVLFMRNQIRPIRKLAVAADRFGRGRGLGAFKPSGAREVRRASRSFIEMAERIKRQIEQRTFMLAGISHDLRTPITRLKLQLSMLKGSPADIKAAKADLEDMETMINGYLDFVRSNSEEPFEVIDVAMFFQKMVRQRSDQVTVNVQGDLQAVVRPVAFERAIGNILSNAERYSDHIWCHAIKVDDDEGERVQIVVEDDGPGVPPENYDDVFRPFFRMDSARSISGGNVGLGLAIAQDIILSHGGMITLDQSDHGGLKVILSLPL